MAGAARLCQALDLGAPPVAYLSRAVPDRALLPFHASAAVRGLAVCETLAKLAGLDSQGERRVCTLCGRKRAIRFAALLRHHG